MRGCTYAQETADSRHASMGVGKSLSSVFVSGGTANVPKDSASESDLKKANADVAVPARNIGSKAAAAVRQRQKERERAGFSSAPVFGDRGSSPEPEEAAGESNQTSGLGSASSGPEKSSRFKELGGGDGLAGLATLERHSKGER